MARRLVKLKDFEFYLLYVYNEIFPETDVIYEIMQRKRRMFIEITCISIDNIYLINIASVVKIWDFKIFENFNNRNDNFSIESVIPICL